MYKEDLALNNLQWLICHKTQPNQSYFGIKLSKGDWYSNQPTNHLFFFFISRSSIIIDSRSQMTPSFSLEGRVFAKVDCVTCRVFRILKKKKDVSSEWFKTATFCEVSGLEIWRVLNWHFPQSHFDRGWQNLLRYHLSLIYICLKITRMRWNRV